MNLQLGPVETLAYPTITALMDLGYCRQGMLAYSILPVPKPRMTQRDKWKKRPCVMRYRAFCDLVRMAGISLPMAYHVVFVLPTANRKLWGWTHDRKPDRDNLDKALMDAVLKDDSKHGRALVHKVWGETGMILVGPLDQGDVR